MSVPEGGDWKIDNDHRPVQGTDNDHDNDYPGGCFWATYGV